ncbi:MAG: gamma carbonic anhydrase family protein [Lachnospiraceae bacterium]|nr:gamma carbonic anhydrase family protein [Lachnospiraceae bacterium]
MEKKEFYKYQHSTDKVKIFPGAVVVGDVKIGEGSSVWYNAVVRGDENPIVIGKNTNVQDCAVIHCNEVYPTIIGDGVTIGHAAIVHSATIGDNTLIGMGAIILNGAVIGKDCLIGAGALVTGKTVIPDGSLVLGSPAKVKRQLTEEEIEGNRFSSGWYKENLESYDI